VADHLATDDDHALEIASDIVSHFTARKDFPWEVRDVEEPAYDPKEIGGVLPRGVRKGYDVREVIARVVDASRFHEFKALYGSTLVTGFAHIMGFPVGILWLAAVFFIAWVVLNRTKFGRYTFAMGSNFEAARLSGIKTKYWLTLVYTLCGFFCGLAGIFFSAVYTTIIPSTGNGLELLAIAGVVIGGTSMSGGTGSLTGTIIGVFTMSILRTGLMSMGLQGQWQTFMTGAVVIGAVLLDQYRVSKTNAVKKV
jgi:ribose/xylose/arabinose/galactoside ABC-type transport system permease subunit